MQFSLRLQALVASRQGLHGRLGSEQCGWPLLVPECIPKRREQENISEFEHKGVCEDDIKRARGELRMGVHRKKETMSCNVPHTPCQMNRTTPAQQ